MLSDRDKDAIFGKLHQYAKNDRTGKLSQLRQWLSGRFGGAGDILALAMDYLGRNPSEADIVDAVELVEDSDLAPPIGGSGMRTPTPPPFRPRGAVRGPQAPRYTVGGPKLPNPYDDPSWPAEHDIEIIDDDWPPEHDIEIIDDDWPEEHAIDTRRVMAPYAGEDLHGLEPEIQTPESSNVFSFQYDRVGGILYVTFKAPGRAVGRRRKRNVCTGEEGWVYHRPHVRGPQYAYGGSGSPIPPQLYEDLIRASSKGGWVWSQLRVCGSMHAHQYPYRLTTGAAMDGGGIYVPRKATERGFRRRSIVVTPDGRPARKRGTTGRVIRSQLPDRIV